MNIDSFGSHIDERMQDVAATFRTEADQESVRPKKTMKKKGPQRSQSRSALPGSSRNGLGKTTSLRLLTMRERSRLTVSQTGSVSVLVGAPNPSAAMGMGMVTEAEGSGAEGEKGGTGRGLELAGGGTEGELEMGMDARGGDEGRAGSTAAAEGAALMRLSISSMSDLADEGWSGMVSPWVGWKCAMAASRVRAPGGRRAARSRGGWRDVDQSASGRGGGGKKKRAITTTGSDGTGCGNGD
jgi:hypothetical protein